MVKATSRRTTIARQRQKLLTMAQVPFALLAAIGILALHASYQEVVDSVATVAWASTVVIFSAAVLFIPWERLPRGLIVIVPLFDVVVVAVLKGPVFGPSDAATFLVIFPVLWIGYALPVAVASAASFTAGLAVSAVPWLGGDQFPNSGPDWFSLLALPFMTLGLGSVISFATSRRVESGQEWQTIPDQILATQAEAERTQATLYTFAEAVGAAAVIFDAEGRVLFRNSAAVTLDDLVHTGSTDDRTRFLYREDGVTAVEAHDESIVARLTAANMPKTTYWVGPPDDRRAVSVSSRTISLPGGQPAGTMVIANDVTDLVNAVSARDQFLTLMSHELNTPLTNIIGYAELIDGEDQGVHEEITVIRRNAARLQRLITNLLVVGRGGASITKELTDVSSLLGQTVLAFDSRAASSGLTLSYEAPDSLIADVSPSQLSEILGNVLANAFNATPAGGTICVTLTAEEDALELTVEDDGRGIAEKDLSRLFEAFYRTEAASRLQQQGAGTGLFIAEKYASAHGGAISIRSTLGQGTIVSVTIPR